MAYYVHKGFISLKVASISFYAEVKWLDVNIFIIFLLISADSKFTKWRSWSRQSPTQFPRLVHNGTLKNLSLAGLLLYTQVLVCHKSWLFSQMRTQLRACVTRITTTYCVCPDMFPWSVAICYANTIHNIRIINSFVTVSRDPSEGIWCIVFIASYSSTYLTLWLSANIAE